MQNVSRTAQKNWQSSLNLQLEPFYANNRDLEAEVRQAIAVASTIAEIAADLKFLIMAPVNWLATKVEQSRHRAQLNNLDDRTLADIGIRRDQIDGIVDGTIRIERPDTARVKLAILNGKGADVVAPKPQDDLPIAA